MEITFPIEFKGHSFDPNPCGIYESPGVYVITRTFFATNKTEIVYIGSSKNMWNRIHKPSHPYRQLFNMADGYFVSASCTVTDDYLELEKEMIRHFIPLLNTQHNGKLQKLLLCQ